MPDFHHCPCGWQMIATAKRAIAAHDALCLAVLKPEPPPLDIDSVIDNAARGRAPERALDIVERAAVLHRLLTIPPGEMFERMFRQPMIEEMDREAVKDASK